MAVQTTNFPLVRTITQLVRANMSDDVAAPGFPFVPLSVQAAAGIVTATFATPPGFLADDVIQVVGMFPTALNGQATIGVSSGNQIVWQNNSAPNGLASTIGTIQGYGTGKKYTDPILMPWVNSAYRGLQRALKATGSTEFRQDEAFITIPGLTFPEPSTQVFLSYEGLSIASDADPPPAFDITTPLGALPADLLMPRKLWERPTGSQGQFIEMVDLTNEGGLPSRVQGVSLHEFAWLDDSLVFLGATQDIDIRVEYDLSLPPVADGSSQLMVLNSEDYHALAVTAMASKARGGEAPTDWDQAAEDAKDKLIGAVTRGQQFKSFRSRPFSRRRGYGRRYY